MEPVFVDEDDLQVDTNTYQLRPRSNIKPLKRYELNFTEMYTPETYEEAMNSGDKKQWEQAIHEEFNALKENDVWEVVTLPENKSTIQSKWVFKIKQDDKGNIVKYKARLCAKGCNQREGIDYTETFSPTTRYDSIRVLLAIVVRFKLKLKQVDVKTAFLYGDLTEEIYIQPWLGVGITSNQVCKLKKALYGLKQSPRNWNKKFDYFVKEFGFTQSQANNCLYVYKAKNCLMLLILYVDDGLLMSNNEKLMNQLLSKLNKQFKITTPDVGCYGGLQIEQDKTDGSIFIHQSNYIKQVVQRFNLEDANSLTIPADPHVSLQAVQNDIIANANVPYRVAVGCLMYIAIVSRMNKHSTPH
ncbi:hypothetical protein Trydic_g8329 [Trypoxylus dichotomus]